MVLPKRPIIVWVIWIILLGSAVVAAATARWSVAFVSLAAFVLTILPSIFVRRFDIQLPMQFLVAIAVFVFATLFLGEVFDFYERYWWWDVLLHGGSAVGFGLIGFLFIFVMFEGDKYAAPPLAVSFVAYCFAITIGAAWEIFEFAMDQLFGMNMQKTGLMDTMWDLIVDMIGASLGATAGYFYLKGLELGGLFGVIDAFVSQNKKLFKKLGVGRK